MPPHYSLKLREKFPSTRSNDTAGTRDDEANRDEKDQAGYGQDDDGHRNSSLAPPAQRDPGIIGPFLVLPRVHPALPRVARLGIDTMNPTGNNSGGYSDNDNGTTVNNGSGAPTINTLPRIGTFIVE